MILTKWSPESSRDLSECLLHLSASHHCASFHTLINASYIQLLSIGLFVFSKQFVCLLFHPQCFLNQSWNSTVTLYISSRFGCFTKFTPSTTFEFRSICGSTFSCQKISFCFRMWKCFIGVVKNNEDKAGLCGGRNAFLTHVNEWRLTFHSSRPFTEWQH